MTKEAVTTDKDGDVAKVSDEIEIGDKFTFKDDGPSVTQGTTDETPDALEVDETDLTTDATADFSVSFESAVPTYGADGAGTTVETYTLSATANGATGLKDTATR